MDLSTGPTTPAKGAHTPRQQIHVKAEDTDMPPVGSEAFVELQQSPFAPSISPDPPCPYLEASCDPSLCSPSSSLKRKAVALDPELDKGMASYGSLEPDTPGALLTPPCTAARFEDWGRQCTPLPAAGMVMCPIDALCCEHQQVLLAGLHA